MLSTAFRNMEKQNTVECTKKVENKRTYETFGTLALRNLML